MFVTLHSLKMMRTHEVYPSNCLCVRLVSMQANYPSAAEICVSLEEL
jgi:hypothetical protein